MYRRCSLPHSRHSVSSASLLSSHFERFAEAPGGMAQLRMLILRLAVHGRLVEQDAKDEPAEIALKRTNKDAVLIEGKVSYPVSRGWCWTTLGSTIVSNLGGGTPSKNNQAYWKGSIPWASVKDVGKTKYLSKTQDLISESGLKDSSSNLIPPGRLIVVTRMGLGKLSINTISVAINQDLRALEIGGAVNIDYLYNFFLTQKIEGTGMTVKGIKQAELIRIPVPLPPLAEQRRIVAKVEELMGLCESLEDALRGREAIRIHLRNSSFHFLTSSKVNNGAIAFILDNLSRICCTHEDLKRFRSSILQLAVSGKLVAQGPEEQATGKGKTPHAFTGLKNRVFAEIIGSMKLPRTWTVLPLTSVAAAIVDCPHSTPKWTVNGKMCVRTNQFRPGYLDLTDVRFVSEDTFRERTLRLEPKENDILYSREGGILGVACRIPARTHLCLGQRMILIRPGIASEPRFLEMVLNSPLITAIALGQTTGGAAPRVNVATIKAYPIPLPPLAEQRKIVAKVDELTTMVDALEYALAASRTTSENLLAATIAGID